MKVWIVGLRDYGDNGWSVAAVCASEALAHLWMDMQPKPSMGYYELEYNWDDKDMGYEVLT